MNWQRISHYAANAAKIGYAIPDTDFPRMLRNAASAAKIPAEMRSGVWQYRDADIHVIAEVMGLQAREKHNRAA